MFLKVALGIIIKLDGEISWMIGRDWNRSWRFILPQGGLEKFSGAVLLNVDYTYWPKGAVT